MICRSTCISRLWNQTHCRRVSQRCLLVQGRDVLKVYGQAPVLATGKLGARRTVYVPLRTRSDRRMVWGDVYIWTSFLPVQTGPRPLFESVE